MNDENPYRSPREYGELKPWRPSSEDWWIFRMVLIIVVFWSAGVFATVFITVGLLIHKPGPLWVGAAFLAFHLLTGIFGRLRLVMRER